MKALLDLLFPPKCAFCGALLPRENDGVCARCRKELPRTSPKDRRVTFVKSVTAPFYYEGEVRRSLLAYKFRALSARGRVYGRLVGEELLARGVEFDLLSWVPLSRRRLRRRGYGQARLIAEGAAEKLGMTVTPLLCKSRDVPPQSRIRTAEGRRANISGCYQVPEPASVRDKRILLVDDIITTGSTVSECARMLMLAGAREVLAASVAIHRDDTDGKID